MNKRKKNSRQRGSHTHGWGAKKKHRGAGHRGGVGRAGSGKRADQKKPSILKEFGSSYFGRKGFKRPQKKVEDVCAFNVGDICSSIERFVKLGLVKKEDDVYVVDKGVKVLGRGSVDLKLRVVNASKNAAEKIKKAGGEVIGSG